MDSYRGLKYRRKTRLEDLVAASIEAARGRDPVTKQQLPMFGLNSRSPLKLSSESPLSLSPYGSQRALSVSSDAPVPASQIGKVAQVAGFRTSQFPKSPLTPELKSKLRVLTLYNAFLRSGRLREHGAIFVPRKNSRKSECENAGQTHRKVQSVTLKECAQDEQLRSTLPSLAPAPQPSDDCSRPLRILRPIPLLPLSVTAHSPKSRQAALSRESQMSAQTPLEPVYTKNGFGTRNREPRKKFHFQTRSTNREF